MKRKKRLTLVQKIALGRINVIKQKQEIAAKARKRAAQKLNKELNKG